MRTWSVNLGRPAAIRLGRWLLLGSGLVAAGTTCLWALDERVALQGRAEQRMQALAHQSEQKQEQLRRASAMAQKPAYTNDPRWKQALGVLNWPWLEVLSSIEKVTHPPVYVLMFKPDSTAGVIRLECEADAFEGVIEYLKALQGIDLFDDARLIRHEEDKDPQGRGIVRFSVQFKLRQKEGR